MPHKGLAVREAEAGGKGEEKLSERMNRGREEGIAAEVAPVP